MARAAVEKYRHTHTQPHGTCGEGWGDAAFNPPSLQGGFGRTSSLRQVSLSLDPFPAHMAGGAKGIIILGLGICFFL